jgi:ornithine carbamoyltransferase
MAANGITRRNLHTITSLNKQECTDIVIKAKDIKAHPEKYYESMRNRTILMLFEKPSLRTRVSLESGMNQMGGHAIFYSIVDSPLGKMKENIHDTAKTASRYVDVIAARLYSRKEFQELAKHATVPVINLLDDYGHPCQILADLLTISEHRDITKAEALKLTYFGDGKNNVTYDLMRLCALFGWHISIACPAHEDFYPEKGVLEEVNGIAAKTGSQITITADVNAAVAGADIVYTDTWMSYGIKPNEEPQRKAVLQPFQVTQEILAKAKEKAIFMHCLPATRGNEMTEEVIDGPKSVVFDQAENRLHVQKSIILNLLGKY